MRSVPCTMLVPTLLLVASCGEEGTGPAEHAVVGYYEVTELTTTANGRSTNWTAGLGATLHLHLFVGWTTDGHLNLPDPLATVHADLAGTWSIVGDSVAIYPTAEVFLRNMRFAVHGTTLVGDRTVGGTRYRVTLAKK